MKIPSETWKTLANLLKNRLLAKFDPTTLVMPDVDFYPQLNLPHKGFYLTVFDSSKTKIARVGFLEDKQSNVIDSGNKVIEAAYTELQRIPYQRLQTGTFAYTCVWDSIHVNNGLLWNENEDGVYLSWGERYKGMYLPVEIQNMTVPKHEIMNRLCMWEAKVPSNLWRLPECLVFVLRCDSYQI